MTHYDCSLLSCGVIDERHFEMTDYQGAIARWCPGCGDHAILTAAQRLLQEEQLEPEHVVFVSGIGCSSRFPHYMKTYGFHGLHGRALPVATGVKLERPDLDVFVVMGDGDCCSIGAGHWIHATRYNMKMVALLLDNNMYGLTKGQTSPTTPVGFPSNTQPQGTYLQPINPIQTTLGVTNASFVAQTAEWIPQHLYATLKAAYHHKGFAFIRVLQRCPVYTASVYEEAVRKPDVVEMLIHDDGIHVPELDDVYKHRLIHDPRDLDVARSYAEVTDRVRLGIFYKNENRPRYEDLRRLPAYTAEERVKLLNEELDRYAV
jgi:2-oxoglutarate ferredoxin oxidoreductase subunit beta